MNGNRHTALALLGTSLLAMLSLTGCFTGVESTKAITQKDVNKAIDNTKVAKYADNRALYAINHDSFPDWESGKLFFVTDDNIKLLFTPSTTLSSSSSLKHKLLKYSKYTTYKSIESKDCINIHFIDTDSNEFVIATNKTLDEFKQAGNYYTIPFLIDIDEILQLRSMLKNKELYIKTSLWYDADERLINGRKFIKITIKDILPGNKVFPYKIRFSAGNSEAYLFMSSDLSSVQNRSFNDLFSTTDIHERYPEISDEIWQHIINGDVVLDMTKDECRLALGAPKAIDRRPTYDGLKEYWTYDNGVFLIFEDGQLRKFRK